ncbi:uncharacterized protein J8A68_000819 [[Candida] subhashii]|uniref:Uncharacterized protein n=1 Tax=[Candida] subhashii TaxID=561895 RepID=A0A8J5UKP7_9ASCO|nr:uncharacterized protein J8A68_000819 [[Candida] subhashii]KAG7665613.1 hypothetical protein J8A68_000819 [[Candida] subhashii]
MQNSEVLVPQFLSLPLEVLDLVFSYIPTIYLLTYPEIPGLNEVLRNALNDRHIEVSIGKKLIVEQEEKFYSWGNWNKEPIGDETRLDSRFVTDVNDDHLIKFDEDDCTERFLDFMYRHPLLKPKVIINGVDNLKRLLNKDPSCFEQISSLSFVKGSIENQVEFLETACCIPYPINCLGTLDDLSILRLSKSVESLYLLLEDQSNLQSLKSREQELKELRLLSPMAVGDLKYLPNSLKTLEISLELNSQRCSPNLPHTLETLLVKFSGGWEIKEFDVSGLNNLKELKLENFYSETLRSLKGPKDLESLIAASHHLTSLDSIDQYTRLKQLQLRIMRAKAHSILSCTFPDSLQKLGFEWWSGSIVDYETDYLEEELPISLPSNLQVLHVFTDSDLLSRNAWNFPQSLRVLSLNMSIMPPGFQLPPNLIALSISQCVNDRLPSALPKSLVRLSTSVLPPNRFCLTRLTNLTYLRFTFVRQSIDSFNWRLPTSLRRLKVQQHQMSDFKVSLPHLKSVGLYVTSPGNFRICELPDSVTDVTIYAPQFQFERLVTGKEIHKLPPNSKTLDLHSNFLDPESLRSLQLENFQHLWYVNLYFNRINELETGMFPISLEILILSKNTLERVDPHVFKNLPRLQYLYLEQCFLGLFLDMDHPLEFPSRLRFIQLANNGLEHMEVFQFPAENMLRRIDLRSNRFEGEGAILEQLRNKLGHEVVIEV